MLFFLERQIESFDVYLHETVSWYDYIPRCVF